MVYIQGTTKVLTLEMCEKALFINFRFPLSFLISLAGSINVFGANDVVKLYQRRVNLVVGSDQTPVCRFIVIAPTSSLKKDVFKDDCRSR